MVTITCINCDQFNFNVKTDKGLCGFSGEIISHGFSDEKIKDMPQDGYCLRAINEKARRMAAK